MTKTEDLKPTIPRPILKWAGGKTSILPDLLQYITPHLLGPGKAEYFEPFAGGAAVFFALRRLGFRNNATLGDMNEELVTTYRAVRDYPAKVEMALRKMRVNKTEYYRIRDNRRASTKKVWSQAARMIYLNKAGFNGLYRVNRDGEFNVPYGKRPRAKLFEVDNFRAASAALRKTTIVQADFEEVCARVREGDVVYFDPPYWPADEESFTSYTHVGFGRSDQYRLRDLALSLKRNGVHVIISNSIHAKHLFKLREFTIHEVLAARSINRNGEGRGKVKDLIIV